MGKVPYALVGIAAVATWWLASTGHRSAPAKGADAMTPGYYFHDAELEETDASGNPVLKLRTVHAVQNPVSQTVELRGLTVDYQAGIDSLWHGRADAGQLPKGSDLLTLRGNVSFHGDGPGYGAAVLHTDLLTIDRTQRIAMTDAPARIDWPPHQLTAEGFKLDLRRRTLQLEHSVHGTFHR